MADSADSSAVPAGQITRRECVDAWNGDPFVDDVFDLVPPHRGSPYLIAIHAGLESFKNDLCDALNEEALLSTPAKREQIRISREGIARCRRLAFEGEAPRMLITDPRTMSAAEFRRIPSPSGLFH